MDVLWYVGDEVTHKPDQKYPFPQGYKYDYCNPDVLYNRLSVKDGRLFTPEGQSYEVLWIQDNENMSPRLQNKVREFMDQGVKVVLGPSMTEATMKLFGVSPRLWADAGEVLWTHRKTDGAEWFFIAAPTGKDFHGSLLLRASGEAEIWDPVSGQIRALPNLRAGDTFIVQLDLERAGNCFVVFKNHTDKKPMEQPQTTRTQELRQWTLQFPEGWGAPAKPLKLIGLQPWKDLPMSEEGKAFSGTAVYETTFTLPKGVKEVVLDLGRVDMIADVTLNGKPVGVLWASPYKLTVKGKAGRNTLRIAVTGTWFNRLAYDAALPEAQRKTWTLFGPEPGSPLRESGLMGPVRLLY